MTAKSRPATKTINLALQGGGAHGAYTWGVLDRLLEDERIVIEGISATSAGAMNAAALAQGLTDGGAAGARATLEAFWRSVSRTTSLSPLQPTWLDRWFGNWNMDYSPAYLAFDLLTRTFSPNQFNPLGLNPLRDLLLETIDFERLRCCAAVKLFVSATNVRTAQIKVFKTEEISADVLMASAFLPFLHRTVAIDGEHYWDGGYMGNPAIFPLIYAAPDVVNVRINPIRRDDLSRSAREILNRANEISFNASPLRELRAIGFVTRLIDQGLIKEGALKRVLVHGIDAEDLVENRSVSARLQTRRGRLKPSGSGRGGGCGRAASRVTAVGGRGVALAASALALSLALCGAPAAAQDDNDPLEPANRAVFQFNQALDGVILEPLARGYRTVTPEVFRESVSNVLDNLATPGVLANDLLQGEFNRAELTLGRFMINTILGLGGIIDVASWIGMPPRHFEDFGQTLATYGVREGPYLVLPVLGPSNPRDAVGRAVDLVFDPFFFMAPAVVQLERTGAQGVDSREQNIETLEELEKSSIDLYAATRTLSRQHRANEIRNGAPPPLEDIYGDDIDEFDNQENREAG